MTPETPIAARPHLVESDSRAQGPDCQHPDLSIVIVSWNVCQDLRNCLASLFRSETGLRYEVIVVDNGSSDDTLLMVRSEFPLVTRIANPGNVGFARANNQGFQASAGEFLLMLNPDTIVSQGVLDACVASLRARPDVGVLGCRLVYGDGSPQLEAGRRLPRIWDYCLHALYLHAMFPRSPVFNRVLMPQWDHADCREVECLVGAFMLFRREELLSLGMLDDSVFMYHEDVEICHRVRQAGRKVWFLGTESVVHLSGRCSAKADRPLWLLEGEVKCQLMRSLYGAGMAVACRWLIGFRSVLRLAVGLVAWIPARAFRFAGREPDVFDLSRSMGLLWWSLRPSSIVRHFPGMVNQWERVQSGHETRG